MASPFDPVTEAIQEHLAGWSPDSADEALSGLRGITEVISSLRDALTAIRGTLEERPGMATTVASLNELAGHAGHLATLADEQTAAFKDEHKFWLGG
jgi:hypothetical protein